MGELPDTRRARRVAIALPAKDEAERITACVRALDISAGRHSGPVVVVALLNSTTDNSAAILATLKMKHIALDVRVASLLPCSRHAGWARRLALEAAAEYLDHPDDMLLSTDADSYVAPDWIARTCAWIDAGFDAVAGRALTPAIERAAFDARGRDRLNLLGKYYTALDYLAARGGVEQWPCHAYEGGASIALTRAIYDRIGEIPAPPVAEDRALFAAIRRAGGRVRHAVDVRVFTSCRIDGRAPGGMADTVRRWLEQDDDAPLHETPSVQAALHPGQPSGAPLSFRGLRAELATAQLMIRASRAALAQSA